MLDYPDVLHLPEIIYISMEELESEIHSLLTIRNNNVGELAYILEEVLNTITINSNYIDNLQILLEDYKSSILTKEDREVFDNYSQLIYKLANLLAYKLKQLNLYSIDDTAYYTLNKCHTPILLSIVRTYPVQFWSEKEQAWESPF